jgi:hypothetical protein
MILSIIGDLCKKDGIKENKKVLNVGVDLGLFIAYTFSGLLI